MGVLRRIRKAQENGARLAEKQVAHLAAIKCVANFLGLPVFKRADSLAS
jgi:hypothetical protein